MRLKELSLLMLLIIPVQGLEVVVILKNYDGDANLRIFNESGLFAEKTVKSGEILTLPEGNYTFELNALNKTFIKRLALKSNETLEFNLGFTNSTQNLNVMLHTIINQNGSVDEIIVVSNRGDLNFEGDLEVQMPAFSNLQVIATNLDFLSLDISSSSITFRSLLVPENGSGSIRIAYTLASEEIERNLTAERVMIIPLAEIIEYRNLSYNIREFDREASVILEGSGSYYLKLKFAEYSESPIVLISIFLISASLFFIFFERRGRWKE
ncbi:MAG: hypothetical protein QXT98_01810 [Archaeoglobaceae archaeon]